MDTILLSYSGGLVAYTGRWTIRRKRRAGAAPLREIAATVGSTDPIKERATEKARAILKSEILRNEDMIRGATTGDSIQVQTSGEVAEELKSADLQKLFEEVAEEVLIPRAGGASESAARKRNKAAKPKTP